MTDDFSKWRTGFVATIGARRALTDFDRTFAKELAEPAKAVARRRAETLRETVLRECFYAQRYEPKSDPFVIARKEHAAREKRKALATAARRLASYCRNNPRESGIAIETAERLARKTGLENARLARQRALETARQTTSPTARQRALETAERLARQIKGLSFPDIGSNPTRRAVRELLESRLTLAQSGTHYECVFTRLAEQFDEPEPPLRHCRYGCLRFEKILHGVVRLPSRETMLLFALVFRFKMHGIGAVHLGDPTMPRGGQPCVPLAAEFVFAVFGKPPYRKTSDGREAERRKVRSAYAGALKSLAKRNPGLGYAGWPVADGVRSERQKRRATYP